VPFFIGLIEGIGHQAVMRWLLILCLPLMVVAETYHPSVEVYFSPKGGCTESVVAELAKAKRTVYVQAYSFTSAPIASAIVEAHKRGVAVQVVLEEPTHRKVFIR
jgi:phosphatidylserine/phosphatidylglycerophosphate/cardiolipin synthase-like enzyme